MKKFYLTLLLGVLPLLGFAQQGDGYRVSTDVQKKNVLLEEFTGVKCKHCPKGHRIASDLKLIFGDKLNVISIHFGHYAYMNGYNYTTEAGDKIGSLLAADTEGFPNGSVNRNNWNGPSDGQYCFGRYAWSGRVQQASQEDAPVNLWASAEYDASTRNMTIHTEGYFTGSDINATQRLSVLLLQNDVKGYQNDEGFIFEDYVHNHMLRDAVNGALGDLLENCTTGSYFAKDYTYSVPEKIGDVDVDPVDLELAVIVTDEDGRHVQNSIMVKPTYPGQTFKPEASIRTDLVGITDGYNFNFLPVILTNKSNSIINNAEIEISFNQKITTYKWTGKIDAFASKTINIPIDWSDTKKFTNKYYVTVKKLNGEDAEPSSFDGFIDCPGYVTDADVTINITTCIDIDEFIYRLLDEDGRVVKEFGPYEGEKMYEEKLSLYGDSNYCLEVFSKWGNGYYPETDVLQLCNNDGTLVASVDQHKGFATRLFFKTGAGPKKEVRTLSVTSGTGGEVGVNGDVIRDATKEFTCTLGEEVTLDITPDNGFRVKSVMAGDKDMTSAIKDNKLVIKMDEDCSVNVLFEEIRYDVTVSAGKGGTIEILGEKVCDGEKTFQCTTGTKVTFTVTADEGYDIKEVMVNDTDVKSSLTDGAYTVEIKDAVSIKVAFEEISGISEVVVSEDDAPVYDLNGNRVYRLVKGNVYVKKGRKFVAR